MHNNSSTCLSVHTYTDTSPGFQALGSLNVSAGQSICVDATSLLSLILASYEAPPGCVPTTCFFSTLFSLFAPFQLDSHTATNSPKSNLLNKPHAPPLLQDSRARLMHVLLQAQDCNQLRPGNIVPGVYNNSKVRAEEIKGSFNRELSWLLSYAGHSSRSRGQYRCEPQAPSTVFCWRS